MTLKNENPRAIVQELEIDGLLEDDWETSKIHHQERLGTGKTPPHLAIPQG